MAKKDVINEAKVEFEGIKNYAKEQAIKELEQRLKPKLQEMMNNSIKESVTIDADGANIEITDNSIEVTKNDSKVTVDMGGADATSTEDVVATPEADSEEVVSTEDAEEMIFEITMNEDEAVAEIANPFDSIMKKLDAIEKKLEGGSTETPEAEGEVTIVDDETAPAPVAEPVAPTAEMPIAEPTPAAPAPIQEFKLDEIENMENTEDFVSEIMKKLEEDGYSLEEMESDDDATEVVDSDEDFSDIESDSDEDSIEVDMNDDSEDVSIEIEDDCSCEIENKDEDSISIEIEMGGDDSDNEIELIDSNEDEDDKEGEEVDEMLGLGLATRRKDKTYIPHVPHKEMNEIKAQYESKLDELIKENGSLKKDIKEFEESFVELRNSIDEMQTFNAKLALANKLFLNGGLSTDDKMKINEALDKATTVKEAEKVYQKLSKGPEAILKESKITDKIKSRSTTIVSNLKPNYQSEEVKTLKEGVSRSQILAGIKKQEE